MTRADLYSTATQLEMKIGPMVLPYVVTPLMTDVQILCSEMAVASQQSLARNAACDVHRVSDLMTLPERIVGGLVSHTA